MSEKKMFENVTSNILVLKILQYLFSFCCVLLSSIYAPNFLEVDNIYFKNQKFVLLLIVTGVS